MSVSPGKKGQTCACAGSSATGSNATSATTTAGDALCAAHSTGPFCVLCEDGYYRKKSSFGTGGTGCSSCDEDEDVVAATMTFLATILAIMIALFAFWQRTMLVMSAVSRGLGIDAIFKARALKARALKPGSSQVSYAWWRLVLMQIWYMMQSMSRYVDSQNITFPDPFQTFIRVTHLINLDVGIVPSTACVFTFDYYDVMMTWSLIPVAVVGIGVLRIAFLKLELTTRTLRRKSSADENDKASRADQRKFLRGVESAVAGAMLVVCIFHSSVCAAVIDFFNCDPPTGDRGYEAGVLHSLQSSTFRLNLSRPELQFWHSTQPLIPPNSSHELSTKSAYVELKSGRV